MIPRCATHAGYWSITIKGQFYGMPSVGDSPYAGELLFTPVIFENSCTRVSMMYGPGWDSSEDYMFYWLVWRSYLIGEGLMCDELFSLQGEVSSKCDRNVCFSCFFYPSIVPLRFWFLQAGMMASGEFSIKVCREMGDFSHRLLLSSNRSCDLFGTRAVLDSMSYCFPNCYSFNVKKGINKLLFY